MVDVHVMSPTMKTFILVLTATIVSSQELVSPCPRLFKYEPRNSNEPDRWYGQVTLLSDADLSGVWLRLLLDKPSIQLGNWFGEVNTQDNMEYLVKNRNFKLKANTPQVVRFYIKYDTREPPPKLSIIRLNARTVCPEGQLVATSPASTGQLITSSELSTTPSSVPVNRPQAGGSNTYFPSNRPTGGFLPNVETAEEDDFFQGDFSYLNNKPTPIANNVCGVVVKQPRPLITHGQETNEGEFPWHAAIYHAKGIDLTYICGGSLITRNHLLTVAHCVTRRKNLSTLPPSSLVVYLGKYYLKIWSNPGIQDRHIDRIFVHENYNSQTFSFDIAVLKLTQPIEITDYVRPVCLWDENVHLNSVIGKTGVVVGWGFDETGKVTEQLTKAHMPVVSQETCIYSFPDFYSRFTSDKTFCAGFRNGTSVCNGDSGGGMVFPKTGSSQDNPVWLLRGMVSISVALQSQSRCDASHYVVFTDVAKFSDWLKNIISI